MWSYVVDDSQDLTTLPLKEVISIANDKEQPTWRVAAAVKVLRDTKAGQSTAEAMLDGHSFPAGWEQRLSAGVVSIAIGITSGRMSQLTREGCPRNKDKSYSLPEVVNWLRKRAAADKRNGNQQASPLKDEKTKAEIELLHAKIRSLEETMMPKSEHREIIKKLIGSLKDFWLTGIRKSAHRFIQLEDVIQAQDLLIQFFHDGLNAMAGKRD